jgi:Helix-turn-helix domain
MNVSHGRALDNSDLKNNRDLILLYSMLLSYCHGNKTSCFPSVETLMGRCGMSRRTVQLNLRELERRGLILTLPRTTPTGRTTSNEYLMVGLMKVYEEMAAGGFDDEGRKKRKTTRKKSERPLKDSDQPAPQTAHLGATESASKGARTGQVGAHAIMRLQHEADCEAEKPTSNMFSTTEKDSLSVGEAAESGYVDVILQTPSHSNPKPASVESLAAPVPVLPTVHENRPPALPAPRPAVPTRTAAPTPAPVAPQKPAPAPQARPAQPQTPPVQPQARPAQPAPAPVLTPTASAQAFAPRPAEPPQTDRQEPQPTAAEDRQEPRKSIGRYQIQGEFGSMTTCVNTFLEFAERGWVMRSEGAFIAWIETWASIAARSKQFVPEKKRIKNPKAYLVHMIKNGLDRTIVRQADVQKAQEVKRLIQRDGLYPVF